MNSVRFEACEYHADQSLRTTEFRLSGSTSEGWRYERAGRELLTVGAGYRLLRTEACGVCSTDLARHHLPFPLPQVTGHEVVAVDDDGRRYVVEINASHVARGVDSDCPFCNAGLERHCPERLVLGIHALPGGFGPWMLVPERSVLEVPRDLPTDTAVLIEPFAAALNAVDVVSPRNGDRIAVLGPRRLGLLVVAALQAVRREQALDFEILALSRHDHLIELARSLGADDGLRLDGSSLADRDLVDVVFDTTGHPSGLEAALHYASREVHIKSTHGQRAGGIEHLTELVVDELRIAPLEAQDAEATRLADVDVARFAAELFGETAEDALPRLRSVIASSAQEIDLAIRPLPADERSLVRPRGTIWVDPRADRGDSSLMEAVTDRGLTISSSRCGDFRRALALLHEDPALRELGERFITHRFSATDLVRAFDTARSTDCIKAVVEHTG